MSRLPVAAFVALVIATVGAFFVTQHLKVSTPLIQGRPAPVPSTINPVSGGVCRVRNGKGKLVPVSFKRMKVSFYLQNRSDTVEVYIVQQDGTTIVRQIGSDVFMSARPPRRHLFVWNGRLANGRVAPDGVYYVRVALVHEARSLLISSPTAAEPVTVQTTRPHVRVTGVTPSSITSGGGTRVTLRYTGTTGLRPRILIYRLRAGRPRQVKSYAAACLRPARRVPERPPGRPS